MNETTAYVIGGVLVVVVIIALVVGPRLQQVKINLGKIFNTVIQATGKTGAAVTKVDVDGSGNAFQAKGAGSKVSDVDVKGDSNTFKAED